MKTLASLLLVLAVLLTGCKSAAKKKKEQEAARMKQDAARSPENDEVDFQAFVGRLRKAVDAHDVNTLAGMMTTDFAFVLGKTPDLDRKGDGVFKYWDDNGLWPELSGILSEKFVKKGDFMVSPPQFANPAIDYDGYRAGLQRVNGSWKFVYFVNGSG